MTEIAKCQNCGSPLLPATDGAICPRCLIRAALDGPSLAVTGEQVAHIANRLDSPGQPNQIGPYVILQTLGEGGMGIVHLAEQAAPIRRKVALKLIKLGMTTKDVMARFDAERQALALMDHPNIASVFDAGATGDGRPYFVMEYVPGVPITEFCDAHQLSTRTRLELLQQVCAAVQHAHQKGIIHRDLKPSNILVMHQDGRPLPKIIDFGVARATDQALSERAMFTEHGVLIGTPEYMSPEQAGSNADDVDTRTDIYSLGVLLYELLVGGLPFTSTQLRRAGYAEIQRMIRDEEPRKPSTKLSELGPIASDVAARRRTSVSILIREVRGDLDWITLKAIDKDPNRRYASASELAADISRHLEHEPVEAGPPRASYRIRKFIRRHRGAVVAAVALFTVLTTGLIATVSMYLRSEHLADEATRQTAIAKKSLAETQAALAITQAALDQLNQYDLASTEKIASDVESAKEAAGRSLDELTEGDLKNRTSAPLNEARALLARYDKLPNVDHAIALLSSISPAVRDPVAHALLAEAYWRKFEYEPKNASLADRAEKEAGLALATDPSYAPAHVVLAMIDYGQGRYDGALGEAQRAVALDFKNSNAWRELGRAHYRLGRPEDAQTDFRKAVALAPNDWTTRNSLGGLYFNLDRLDDAAREFERIPARAPYNTRAYNNLGSAYLRQGRFDKAIEMYERALSLDENATNYSNLGIAFYLKGLYADAARSFEGAVALPGATFTQWFNLGAACYWAPDMRGRAKEAYERAVALGEETRSVTPNVDASFLLALASGHAVLALLTEGPPTDEHRRKARDILELVEQQQPFPDATILGTLAVVYEELRDRSKALDTLEQAIKTGYPIAKIERSPWLHALRSDERYTRMKK